MQLYIYLQLPMSLTITPTFSICPQHGYLAGEHEFCPRCDAERMQQKLSKAKQVNACVQ